MGVSISPNTLRNWLKKRKKYLDDLVCVLKSIALEKDSEYRSQYYTEAINYLNHFWNNIFAYLQDGEFPIDNNFAERTILKLTTQRNNSLHYGSEAVGTSSGFFSQKS